MSAFTIPALLAETARRQPSVASWVADLPGIVAGLAEHWSLRVGQPFQPGGFCSWTAPAIRLADSAPGDPGMAAGDEFVLKVGFRFDSGEQRDEAAALRVWDGDGAVRIYAELETPASILSGRGCGCSPAPCRSRRARIRRARRRCARRRRGSPQRSFLPHSAREYRVWAVTARPR